jgi:hypothetical protein
MTRSHEPEPQRRHGSGNRAPRVRGSALLGREGRTVAGPMANEDYSALEAEASFGRSGPNRNQTISIVCNVVLMSCRPRRL